MKNDPLEAPAISAAFPFTKRFVEVEGARMACVDEGEGPTVLFVHGNPTSSYLWRNIIPHVTRAGHRAVAVDLIGMGDSARPDIGYTFAEHARYLDGFVAALSLRDLVLVVHDWGSALGLRHARLHERNVRGIAFMEAILPPASPVPNYEAMGPEAAALFRQIRTPGIGEEMVLRDNFFLEVVLPKLGVLRDLTNEERAAYHAPFPTPETRKPILVWPRQVPIGGQPEDVAREVLAYGAWFQGSALPKLYLQAEPGALNPRAVGEEFTRRYPNLRLVDVGPGLHFIQEDCPHPIGVALANWLAALPPLS